MHFHLNFNRLFSEDRPAKLQQQLCYTQNITDQIVPENAFAMYFNGYLQNKVNGKVDFEIIDYIKGIKPI